MFTFTGCGGTEAEDMACAVTAADTSAEPDDRQGSGDDTSSGEADTASPKRPAMTPAA